MTLRGDASNRVFVWLVDRMSDALPLALEVSRDMSLPELLDLAGTSHFRDVATINGEAWDGAARPFLNGDVVQVSQAAAIRGASRYMHHLRTLSLDCLRHSMRRPFLLAFPFLGPVIIPLVIQGHDLPPRARHAHICHSDLESYFQVACARRVAHFLQRGETKLIFAGPGIPPFRVAVDVDTPTPLRQAAAFYHEFLAPFFGVRELFRPALHVSGVEVFVAIPPGYRDCSWLFSVVSGIDIIQGAPDGSTLRFAHVLDGMVLIPRLRFGQFGVCWHHDLDDPSCGRVAQPIPPPADRTLVGPAVSYHTTHALAADTEEPTASTALVPPADRSASSLLDPDPPCDGPASDTQRSRSREASPIQRHPPADEEAAVLLQVRAVVSRLACAKDDPESTVIAAFPAARQCPNADADHSAAPVPLLNGNPLTVYVLGGGQTMLSVPHTATFAEVRGLLSSSCKVIEDLVLVPVFPPIEHCLECIAAPVNAVDHGLVALLRFGALRPACAAVIFAHTTAADLLGALHLQGTLSVGGVHWRGAADGAYPGMTLEFCLSCPMGRSARPIATPCRVGARACPVLTDSAQPRSLALCEHLPQKADGDNAQISALQNLLQSLCLPWNGFWSNDVFAIPLPWSIRNFLLQSPRPCGLPLELWAFTDGSFDYGAGWGAILFGVYGTPASPCWCFIGWAGGRYQEGSERPSNNVAEGMAMRAVLTWALSIPPFVPLHVCSDSQLVLRGTTGLAKPPAQGEGTGVNLQCRYVQQLHEARGSSVDFMWVPGHTGISGNECADAVASCFSECDRLPQSPMPQSALPFWRHARLPWAWMLYAHPDLPSLESFAKATYEPEEVPSRPCIQAVLDDVSHAPVPEAGFVVKLCTANVCSLRDKHPLLQSQLEEEQIAICGIQETRSPSASTFSSGNWLCLHSAAVKGHYGCALWLNKMQLLKATSHRYPPVAKEHCSVLAARHDWLVVRVKWGVLDCVFVVAHAPHTGYAIEERQKWWAAARGELRRHGKIAPLLLLGDLNAEPSCFDKPAIGDLALEIPDASGELVAPVLNELGLALVNTFPSTAFPSSYSCTWRHKMIDFVGVPLRWLKGASQVHTDIDLGNSHDDHRAVVVVLHLPSHRPAFARVHPSSPPDKRVSVQCFPGFFAPWDCNLHTHAEGLFSQAKKVHVPRSTARHKPFLSADSIALLARKKHARSALSSAVARERLAKLRAVWCAWTRRHRPPTTSSRGVALCLARFHAAAHDLRRSIKKDKADYICHIADSIKDAEAKEEGAKVFQSLRFFRPAGKTVKKPFHALPILEGPDGTVATSFDDQQALRAHYFGQMEAAVAMTAAQREHSWPVAVTNTDDSFELDLVPTLCDVEQCIRGLPAGKAPGPSQVPNEVWKMHASLSARSWYPVFLKAHKRVTEPFRFSVGSLFTLYKQRGPQHSLTSFRSIFLLEGLGKGLRKMLRKSLVTDLQGRAPDLFCGCLPGSLTGALTHYLTTAMSVAGHSKHTIGILFLDAQIAYYRVLRGRLTGDSLDDETLCQILHGMGIAPSLVQSILAWADGPPLFATLRPHQQKFLSALFRAPAFLLKGQQWLHSTRSGTRPGDSIADVLFAAVLVDALQDIRARLAAEGLGQVQPGLSAALPTWADDVSLPFASCIAAEFAGRASATCKIVHEEMGRRALELNYGPNKSALLVAWHGEGCRQAQQHLERTQLGICFDAFGTSISVPIVHSYVHLGTRLSSSSGPLPDLRRKCQIGKAQALPLASRVLRRGDISLERRKRILCSIALSASHYNVGIWAKLNAEAQRTWVQAHSDIYRCLLTEDRWQGDPECPSVFEVTGATTLPFPVASLSRERVLHAIRLVQGNYTALWELLCHEATVRQDSWMHALKADLAWIGRWVNGVCTSADLSACSGEEVAVWISEHHRALRKDLRVAIDEQSAALGEWHSFQFCQRRQGVFHGVAWAHATTGSRLQLPCPECTQLFANGSHLMMHAAQCHGHVCPSRRYAKGSRCGHCMKQFWTVERLRRHLASGPECLAAMMSTTRPLSAAELLAVDARHLEETRASKASGRSTHGERAPILKLSGPKPHVPTSAEQDLAFAVCDASPFDMLSLRKSAIALATRCFPAVLPLIDNQSVVEAPRAAVLAFPEDPDGRKWIRQVGTAWEG